MKSLKRNNFNFQTANKRFVLDENTALDTFTEEKIKKIIEKAKDSSPQKC